MTAGAFPDIAAFATENRGTSGGVPKSIGSAAICIVVLLYVFFGGMRGTAWANAFQTIVFMILGLVAFFVLANKLGSGAALDVAKDKVKDGVVTRAEIEASSATPEKAKARWDILKVHDTNNDEKITADERPGILESLKTASGAVSAEKSTRKEMNKWEFFTYLLIPLSVGMFPHLFQHWLTAKSARSFKLPVVAHPIFIMIVWVPCILIGIWATTLLVPDKPPYPLIEGTKIINQNAILPFLVKTQTAPILGGLLTAGILAAIMSSLDSQFLCIGTMFENDLITHYFGKDRFTDKQQVYITRGFIILIVLITYLLGLAEPRSVFGMGVWCFAGFASLFPVVFASLYWRRLTTAGAYAGIFATIACWLFLFYQSDFGANRNFSLDFGNDISCNPVVAIFASCLIAMIGVSLITRPPRKEVLDRFFPENK